jgi:hypothetical protein
MDARANAEREFELSIGAGTAAKAMPNWSAWAGQVGALPRKTSRGSTDFCLVTRERAGRLRWHR